MKDQGRRRGLLYKSSRGDEKFKFQVMLLVCNIMIAKENAENYAEISLGV